MDCIEEANYPTSIFTLLIIEPVDRSGAEINKWRDKNDKVGHRAAGDAIGRKWSRAESQTKWQTQEKNPSLGKRSTAALRQYTVS